MDTRTRLSSKTSTDNLWFGAKIRKIMYMSLCKLDVYYILYIYKCGFHGVLNYILGVFSMTHKQTLRYAKTEGACVMTKFNV